MTETEIRTQADEFIALPKAERREKYKDLPRAVRLVVRKRIESNRGISHRTEGGVMVLTKEEYVHQLLQKQGKLNDFASRQATLQERMVELKRQLQENYGDEALAEAEQALEADNQ